jgi:hypothetical protein
MRQPQGGPSAQAPPHLSFSLSNLAECTPTTARGCPRKAASSAARSGSTCMQLTQQYVQKSRTTTWAGPFRWSQFCGTVESDLPVGGVGSAALETEHMYPRTMMRWEVQWTLYLFRTADGVARVKAARCTTSHSVTRP